MTKSKRTYDPIAHEKRAKTITELKSVVVIIGSIIVTAIILVNGMALITPSDYQEFQDNYEECLAVDNFTQEQCYDIAYATALGG